MHISHNRLSALFLILIDKCGTEYDPDYNESHNRLSALFLILMYTECVQNDGKLLSQSPFGSLPHSDAYKIPLAQSFK